MNIQYIGQPGPSLPLSIRHARARANEHTGKGDPVWSTKFTTKFSRKPTTDAPLVTPMGAAKVITEFLDRVAEIAYLEATQHYELATTRAELTANGLASFSLSESTEEDMEAANLAESHLRTIPMDPDPIYIATMSRRIEWEQYIWKCGPVHKTKFVIAGPKDGQFVGIMYEGPDSKDAAKRDAHRKAFKASWIANHDIIPSVDDLADGIAFCEYYGKPVLAMMTEAEYKEHHDSKRFGAQNEDRDPERTAFNDPTPPPNPEDYDMDSSEERDQYKEDLAEWEAQNTAVGYAGPKGFLGLTLDDDGDDVEDSL